MTSRKFSRRRDEVSANSSNVDASEDQELEIISKFFWFSGVAFYIIRYLLQLKRFIVLKKRSRIQRCSEIISKLNRDMLLNPDSKPRRRFLWLGCGLSLIIPILMMTYGMISGNFYLSTRKYQSQYFFSDKISKTTSPEWEFFIILLQVINTLLSRCLPLQTMILCVYTFTRLRDINHNFLTQLQKSMDLNMPSKLFSDYTKLYGRITNTVEKVEKTFSLISFFLYGYMLSCVFSITSYMITRSGTLNVSKVLCQAASFIEIVTCFIFLSVRAAAVNESAVEVKNLIHSLPSKRFDFSPNLTATLLQLANNFASEVCVTGWGLFMINRGFILTTAGVVVTYGVILVQLGS
ncbi:uncharacterized protein TNIN_383811 [Trichonephila inaurata madagascariensis]|uniref:Gustatory receptor n=1 Tax=Trichonephila inaurata madagascariensis TaxID=2747483 RepID=A0A8X6YHV3_9ARAC|nr:uncharacterized protein TNIN_383811 [Trichonephila inaurata madagascariensis]